MKRNPLFIAVIGVLLVIGFSHWVPADEGKLNPEAITFPSAPVTFQPGTGSTIASSYCLICHSAEYTYTQPLFPREKWTEIVKKMKNVFGCQIPDDQISLLVDYLITQNDIEPSQLSKDAREVQSSSGGSSGDPDKGQVVYETYCLNCHGSEGKGDGAVGQTLNPPAADLTTLGKKSDEDVLQTIRKGRVGTAMPSWEQDLSVNEILDVLSYLRSLGQ